MKICVLQVSYEGSTFEYRSNNMARDLAPLLPEHSFHHEFLRKATTFRQIRRLRRQDFDIYVNLCGGCPDADVPSVDVIMALDYFGLPYTGPNFLQFCPPRDLMKRVARYEDIACPASIVTETARGLEAAISGLRFPLLVKPNETNDDSGVDHSSLVPDFAALERKVGEITDEYGAALIEEYVEGREFAVLVCGTSDPAQPCTFLPVEFRFPGGERFKTHSPQISRKYHPECAAPCESPELAERLNDIARKIFTCFSGEGYARIDFRLTDRGEILFLDTHFGCPIFYPPGYERAADHILRLDGIGQAGFLKMIIEEGIARHAGKRKAYEVRPAGIGYGVFASRSIARGTTVFPGEQRLHRLVTKTFVEKNWSKDDVEVFRRYAYPVGRDVHVMWSSNPAEWAPQNHSCDPNTGFSGLDVIALRDIREGEELTIDYTTFCNENMFPFDCRCGSPGCKGRISGHSETGESI